MSLRSTYLNRRPSGLLFSPDNAHHAIPYSNHFSKMYFLLALLLALIVVLPRAYAETPVSIKMKVLVLAADGTEPQFAAAQAILQQVGIPYDTITAATQPFTATTLSDGAGHGNYQGIILTTGELGYSSGGNWVSALTLQQWQMLWQYEADFKVRQATLYTYPSNYPDTYGLNLVSGVDTNATPIQANLTSAGKTVFGYINAKNPITITNAWTYLATPISSTNPTPLLTTPEGYVIASIYTHPNGRQNLAVTADGNPNLIHSMMLGYGLVNWVTKGFFLGQRKVYLNPQPDDVLLDNDIWDPSVNRENGATYRMTGSDLRALAKWQAAFQVAHPVASRLTIEMPFNGLGSVAGEYPNDTLTPAIKLLQGNFKWISHTYTHANLDTISYSNALSELQLNHQTARNLGLRTYYRDSMIQPDISGLNNPNFLKAAYDFGIRYILSDTSQPGWNNPSPNAGFYSTYQPNILIIPRYPTNLYYNLYTPAQWVSEYNYFYAPGGLFPTWDHPLSYAEILDKESSMMLTYLLKYSINPLMFHQPNLVAYDGVNSLLGDLLAATVAKYEKLFNLPIQSPTQHEIGGLMAQRMAYNASGIQGTIMLGSTNTIQLQTTKAAIIPITGITYGTSTQTYGGQRISNITMRTNSTLSIPAPAW